jgi:hypothetical protein
VKRQYDRDVAVHLRGQPSGDECEDLGINDQHNASACLLEDGVIVAAVQEERFSRIKNQFCFPERSVDWLLKTTETKPRSSTRSRSPASTSSAGSPVRT